MNDLSFMTDGLKSKDRGPFWTTWSGGKIYFEDPRPEDINILDICFSLGQKGRYNNHTRLYTVTEHSYHLSKLVRPENRLVAFAHDFPEFAIPDVVRPLKRVMGPDNYLWQIEDGLWKKAIAPKWGLPLELPQEVAELDIAICVTERRVLQPRCPSWNCPFPEPKGVRIHCWQAPFTFDLFLSEWSKLTGESYVQLTRDFNELVQQDREARESQWIREIAA